jgi:CBS domain-containing protein
MPQKWKTLREIGPIPREVVAVSPDETALNVLALLDAKDIGAVAVVEDQRLVGILSERDCARKLELKGRRAGDTRVREIMTSNVIYVTPDHRIDQCMLIMRKEHLRHLPVVEGDRLVGFLSIRDVLQEVIAEEEHLIHDLEAERLVMTTYTGTY